MSLNCRPGDQIQYGDRRYVVLRPVEDYTLYVEGDTPGICDKPARRKHLPVVPLPERVHFLDQSCFSGCEVVRDAGR